jgi:hypothetical protein
MLDSRNRTFREKLKEWGCRRKARSSSISRDSGYASYAASIVSHGSNSLFPPGTPVNRESEADDHDGEWLLYPGVQSSHLKTPESPEAKNPDRPLPPLLPLLELLEEASIKPPTNIDERIRDRSIDHAIPTIALNSVLQGGNTASPFEGPASLQAPASVKTRDECMSIIQAVRLDEQCSQISHAIQKSQRQGTLGATESDGSLAQTQGKRLCPVGEHQGIGTHAPQLAFRNTPEKPDWLFCLCRKVSEACRMPPQQAIKRFESSQNFPADEKKSDVTSKVGEAGLESTMSSGSASQCPSLTISIEEELDSSGYSSEDGSSYSITVNEGYLLALVSSVVNYWFTYKGGSVDVLATNEPRTCAKGESGDCKDAQHAKSMQANSRSSTVQSVKRSCPQLHRQDDEEDSGSDGFKRTKFTPPSSSDDPLLLACPYYKYDPSRYSEVNVLEKEYRGCSGVYLKDISRLK